MGFFFCASAAGALHFPFDGSSLSVMRAEASKTVKSTATLKEKGDWRIIENAMQNFRVLRRYSESSLTLLRNKGPVAAHPGAVGVRGYHPEMVSSMWG